MVAATASWAAKALRLAGPGLLNIRNGQQANLGARRPTPEQVGASHGQVVADVNHRIQTTPIEYYYVNAIYPHYLQVKLIYIARSPSP
jgi:hypothetical protein